MNRLNLISAVDNNLGIGKNGDLLFKEKEDLLFFKRLTEGNTIVMGRNTFLSLPNILKNRKHIVLTKDTFGFRKSYNNVLFMTYYQFKLYYKLFKNKHFYIIGGSQIYDLFLNDPHFYPKKLFITQFDTIDKEADTFFPLITDKYSLISYSEKKFTTDGNFTYRFLIYTSLNSSSPDIPYLKLARSILEHPNKITRVDRTGVGTIGTFGNQIRFDLSNGNVPILTTKRVAWKSCIKELLWFLRGDTDAKILQRNGVHIWDGNSTREFLDNNGLEHYPDGVIGAGYGWQMRFFGAEYDCLLSDTSSKYFNRTEIGGFDQVNYVISQLRENPNSRRIVMSYWNPPDLDKVVLPPCHYTCVFSTEGDGKLLNCHMIMRSTDVFLGLPFNILSYAILTYIIAKKVDMEPNSLVISLSDTHIYSNHISQIKEQLTRNPLANSKLILSDQIKNLKIENIKLNHFSLIGYFPHKKINGDMAV